MFHFFAYPQPGPPGPPGPDITGDPRAVVYVEPDGSGSETDPDLYVKAQGAYNRPEIVDEREGPVGFANAVWKNGGWTGDGCTKNVTGDGHVVYEVVNLSPLEVNFARVKGSRFGIFRALAAGLYDYAWRVDLTSLFFRDDVASKTFEVNRATGNLMTKGTVQIGGPTGPTVRSGSGSPEGVVTGNPGDLYLNTAGGAGTSMYVKESGTGNTGWVAK